MESTVECVNDISIGVIVKELESVKKDTVIYLTENIKIKTNMTSFLNNTEDHLVIRDFLSKNIKEKYELFDFTYIKINDKVIYEECNVDFSMIYCRETFKFI